VVVDGVDFDIADNPVSGERAATLRPGIWRARQGRAGGTGRPHHEELPAQREGGTQLRRVRISALATVKEVRERLDRDLLEMTERLFAEHRVDIRELPDVRQQEFDDI
jgi:hypothetical protein